MSIPTLFIALALAGAQPNSGSIPSVTPDSTTETQIIPAPAASEGKTDDRPDADLKSANPENPAVPSEPLEQADTVVVTARPDSAPGDPMQAINIQSYSIVQSVDDAVTGPVALAYKKSMPAPVRSGFHAMPADLPLTSTSATFPTSPRSRKTCLPLPRAVPGTLRVRA